MLVLYKIENSCESEFVVVNGYGPTDSMPFLDIIPQLRARKDAYWRVNPTLPGLEIDRRGKKWPSFLENRFMPPEQFVSGEVLSDLDRAGIGIARKTPMPIGKNRSKLPTESAPDYYVVEALPGIAVDFAASGIAVDADGTPRLTLEQRSNLVPLKLSGNSWSGLDLFTLSNYRGIAHKRLYCTDRVVELAKEKGWTNVSFDPQIVV